MIIFFQFYNSLHRICSKKMQSKRKNRFYRRMKRITYKIFFTALFPTIIVGLATGVMILYLTAGSGESSLNAYENTMRRDFDTTAKWQTENVKSLLTEIYSDYLNNKISIDQARYTSAKLVRGLKYGTDGYFWIDSIDGTNIVSSVRSLEALNRIEMLDSDGKFMIKEFIAAAQNGGGFVDYRFPKTKGGEPLPKRSYLTMFEPYNWVIGTGNYVDDIDKAVDIMKNEQTQMLYKMLYGILTLLAATTIYVLFSGRKIAMPIINLTKEAKLLAQGNLNINIDIKSKDEIGELGNSLKSMTKKLGEIINQIKNEAMRTTMASREFGAASRKISDGANQLAATTQEVASSIEEMSAGIEQNSENSSQTENISLKVLQNIIESSKSVDELAKSLKVIINEISIIKDIAKQTNILALNATVEAAGAGVHGKSFAIIAKEIKTLAEDSANAAKKIDKLSINGIRLSNKSVKMLTELVPEMEETVKLVKGINIAATQQKSSVTQINNETGHLSILSQDNASISEETEANANELLMQATHLLDLISFFKQNN